MTSFARASSAAPGGDQGWWRAAACRGLDPAQFHPATELEADAAREVCGGCPVREPCLKHALRVREGHGVWGGLTERERRQVLRRRRVSA